MNKIWKKREIDHTIAQQLSKETKFPIAMTELLTAIGIEDKETARGFLKPDLKKHTHDPFLMLDMEKAIERIKKAIDKGEKILFYGDYDCDGVTTLAIAKRGFKLLGVDVDIYAPDRYVDGYGPTIEKMEKFKKEYDLIISGDTGIRAFEPVKLVTDSGDADMIVTDHHEPLEGACDSFYNTFFELIEEGKFTCPLSNDDFMEQSRDERFRYMQESGFLPKDAIIEFKGGHFICLPDAYAVINPQRLGDPYPCKTLAGVAVMFKLILALFLSKKENPIPLFRYLDYVAVGCIADLVQQIDRRDNAFDIEVRTLCHYGIEVMNRNPKPWVKGIKNVQSIKEDINSTHIGFRIGPLLNAPGRLEGYDPTPSLRLLLEDDEAEAVIHANELKRINNERQKQTNASKAIIEGLESGEELNRDFGITVHSDTYSIGIAGLIAGKLTNHFYRPAIALAPTTKDNKTVLKGSARSIPGVHVLRMLDEVKNDIGEFIYGGHEQAAGMTLDVERFDDFQKAFRKCCQKHSAETFIPKVIFDTDIAFDEIDIHVDNRFMRFIQLLEPFGEANRKPTLRTKNVEVIQCKQTKNEACLSFKFKQNERTLGGITFNNGKYIFNKFEEISEMKKNQKKDKSPIMADILFSPVINEFPKGRINTKIELTDIKFH